MNEASYASLSFMDPYKPSSGLGHILPVYSLGRRIHEHCADVLMYSDRLVTAPS